MDQGGSYTLIFETFALYILIQLEEVTKAVEGTKSASVWGEKCRPTPFAEIF